VKILGKCIPVFFTIIDQYALFIWSFFLLYNVVMIFERYNYEFADDTSSYVDGSLENRQSEFRQYCQIS
jgi:hypothetical protein